MTVAIVTKYHGPTNYRGSRVTASIPARLADLNRSRDRGDIDRSNPLDRPGYWRLTIPYAYELNSEDVHRKAAQLLADRLGWTGDLVAGALDDGYAFTFAPGSAYASDRWTVSDGRALAFSGVYAFSIAKTFSGRDGLSPAALDAMAHRLADILNQTGTDPTDVLRDWMAR